MIEISPDANKRRCRLAEKIHEYLVNEEGYPERDILSKAEYDGVTVEVHMDAGRDE